MTYFRNTTAISELNGLPVNTWSEEWRIETEAKAVLKVSKQERDVFFNGRKDENGKTIDRGLVGIRGPQAAEKIMETARQLQAVREVSGRKALRS
ncbi:hypothetical protein FHR70_003706 [Microvirga lupini]|uniref:Uncharacterized protein n=1 Tax=Microvirga lupini TaxID=420324 RepID=A0A7W4VNU7_9HYPH|nr:hypothetical protein [Microvirga lupini]MBB3020620.1 hypothetical protein [Microvirga lupini]